MKIFIAATALVCLAANATGLTPVGHLTGEIVAGKARLSRTVDLAVRLFERRDAQSPLSEAYFEDVRLDEGRFSVPLDLTALSETHSPPFYVEIGLRPSERHYAMYTTISPRLAVWPGKSPTYQVWRIYEDPIWFGEADRLADTSELQGVLP